MASGSAGSSSRSKVKGLKFRSALRRTIVAISASCSAARRRDIYRAGEGPRTGEWVALRMTEARLQSSRSILHPSGGRLRAGAQHHHLSKLTSCEAYRPRAIPLGECGCLLASTLAIRRPQAPDRCGAQLLAFPQDIMSHLQGTRRSTRLVEDQSAFRSCLPASWPSARLLHGFGVGAGFASFMMRMART